MNKPELSETLALITSKFPYVGKRMAASGGVAEEWAKPLLPLDKTMVAEAVSRGGNEIGPKEVQ